MHMQGIFLFQENVLHPVDLILSTVLLAVAKNKTFPVLFFVYFQIPWQTLSVLADCIVVPLM